MEQTKSKILRERIEPAPVLQPAWFTTPLAADVLLNLTGSFLHLFDLFGPANTPDSETKRSWQTLDCCQIDATRRTNMA